MDFEDLLLEKIDELISAVVLLNENLVAVATDLLGSDDCEEPESPFNNVIPIGYDNDDECS